MRIGSCDLASRVLIIAEIGNNHEGDPARAEEMLRAAAAAGVDAVKFQSIRPDRLVAPSETARLATLERFRLSQETYVHLAKVAGECGVAFMSTPFDPETVEWLAPLMPAVKIASGDLDFVPLLRAVARTAKPVLLSTGLSDLDLVDFAVSVLREEWNRGGVSPGLVLLHCISAYPTPVEDANIAALQALKGRGDMVGYSDHTLGLDAAVLAVGLGARVVEKHFTLDKNLSEFRDHQLSATPDEMAELVRRVRLAETLLGDGLKRHRPAEAAGKAAIRRSVYAARDLPLGTVLAADDLVCLRPCAGLPARDFDLAVGGTLVRPIAAGTVLTAEDFQR